MNILRNTFLIVLCSICANLYAQQSAISYYDSIVGLSLSSEEKNRTLEQLLESSDSISSSDRAQLNYLYWKKLWKERNKKKVKRYLLREYELRKTLGDSVLLKRNLYNLGYVHRRLEIPEYEKALQYFDQLLKMTANTESRLGSIYREKGDIYDELGDFQRALENYQNAERIQKQQRQDGKLIKTYINISGTYARLQDSIYFEDFIKNKEKLEVLTSTYQISTRQQALLKMNDGSMYRTKKNYGASLAAYKEALKLSQEIDDDYISFGVLNNLGIDCLKLGLLEEAQSYFQNAMTYSNGVREREGSLLDNRGDLYMKLGLFEKALSHYQQAVSYLLYADKERLPKNLPDLETVKLSPYKLDILEYLIDKSEAQYIIYKKTKDRTYLLQANETIVLIDQIIDALYFESREDLSKLLWREKGAKLYVMAVGVCFELGDEKRAFYYMEKNKGLMLLENISEAKAKQLGNVTEAVVARERKFQLEIKTLQSELSSKNSETNTLDRDKIRKAIFEKKEAYLAMIDSLAFSFPEYYNFKKKIAIITSETARKGLQANERILSYILGDNEGYVALISASQIELKRIDHIQQLNRDIAQFGAALQQPFQSKEDAIAYRQMAYQLKQKLIPFPLPKEGAEVYKLSIIPDRGISSVPFEALASNIDTPLWETYLLRDFEIHYRYSLSVDTQMNAQKRTGKAKFSGFILGDFQDNYLSNLSKNQTEIDEILNVLDGRVFTDTTATKSNFLKEYLNSDIMHVSTHGGFDFNNPGLAFYDDKLYLDELYFLNNPKELMVLSACKTSVGNEVRGEGVFNFSRGFINSGAKSVVTTLWDVNEKSSSEIIKGFYGNLASGNLKSQSLRKSKLDYLERHKNTSEASPFYWSAIVLTGDNSVIVNDSLWKRYRWLLLVLIAFLAGAILFRRKYKT